MVAMEINELKALLGANVQRLRKEKGLSVRKLALLAGMEHQQILSIEKGGTDIRLSTLLKIATALEVEPEILLQTVG